MNKDIASIQLTKDQIKKLNQLKLDYNCKNFRQVLDILFAKATQQK